VVDGLEKQPKHHFELFQQALDLMNSPICEINDELKFLS